MVAIKTKEYSMNYVKLKTCDFLNGDGIRVTIWLSGCSHACPSCFNPETHNQNAGMPFTDETKQELFDALSKNWCSGITFSGGDPLFCSNRQPVSELIKEIKNKFPTKSIWLYTGYTYEELKEFNEIKPILSNIDVIVDGEFVESLKDVNYHWAGSTNQRVLRKNDPIRIGESQ